MNCSDNDKPKKTKMSASTSCINTKMCVLNQFLIIIYFNGRNLAPGSHNLTFNDNVLGCPLLVEGGEAGLLTDADNMLFEVKVLSVEPKKTKPQLPHCLSVDPKLWPATGLQVEKTRMSC